MAKDKGYGSGYTPREVQAPSETPITEGPERGSVKREHPAYAMVGAYRWTGGGNVLFGSPIQHRAGVTIRIIEAHEQGDEYSWRQSGEKLVCELNMSESQWASFVTAMNVGNGVPCTLTYRQTGPMLRVPAIEDTHPMDRRAAGIREKAEKDMALLREMADKLKAMLDAPGTPSKTALREIYNKYVLHAVDHAPSNYEFLAKQVSAHLEDAVTAAKQEIEGFILHESVKHPALANIAPTIPQLSPPNKESK